MDLHGLGEQDLRAELVLGQHHEGHERRAGEQQAGLDDLHPRRRGHAAEEDIHHHQRTDDDHRDPVFQPEQQLDELPGTHHLRNQVEGNHDQRARCRERADRPLLEAVGSNIGKGEAAQVAQPLRHQEGDDRPAHEEADGVDQAVIAIGEDCRRNAEKRGRRHVVASNCQAVLESGDAAATGVESGCRFCLGCRPFGNEQRANDEHGKHANCRPVGRLPLHLPEVSARCKGGRCQQQRRAGDDGVVGFHATSRLICSVSLSYEALAWRT
ncbi:hypothetical protein D3C87_1116420 [compost metagenome]